MTEFTPALMVCWTCEGKTNAYHRVTAKSDDDVKAFNEKHDKCPDLRLSR